MVIKIAHITHLQDARYCAAMGFPFISFSLLADNKRTLTAQQIREITAWLSGIKSVLEVNEASIAALQAIHGTFPYHYIEIPQADWQGFSFLPPVPFIVQARENIEHAELAALIASLQAHHQDSKVEIHVASDKDYLKYEAFFPHLFLHFSQLDSFSIRLNEAENKPWGFSFREEALDIDGNLDYESLDAICEALTTLA